MYDPKPSKDYCEQIGLKFAEDDFNEFARLAEKHNMTQEQVDFAMMQHAWRVKCLFNPKSYKIKHRILIALLFLNPFAKGV
ncbi:MAG: hypothetical protein JKX96_02865 [Acinetobacter sp.]|nr:hypothetical protein [Acinetobacter sp.]